MNDVPAAGNVRGWPIASMPYRYYSRRSGLAERNAGGAQQGAIRGDNPAGWHSRVSIITIRNLDDPLKRRLWLRAAERGRSMEEEARDILRSALAEESRAGNLAEAIRSRFAPLGGVDLPDPPREPMPRRRFMSSSDGGGLR